jgi:hemerythrin-like domain-containing protein
MDRELPLDPPHKGLRRHLGLLALETGRANWDDAASVAALKELAAFTFAMLAEHAMNEDDFLFARLEERAPGATAEIEAQHPVLHAQATTLAQRFAAIDVGLEPGPAQDLYLDMCRYQAEYLLHLDGEDRHIEPMLLEHFSDLELASIQVEIAQVSPPNVLLDWFAVCVPARSDADNRVVLGRMKQMLPPEAFAAIEATVAGVVTPERRTKLFDQL